jgi:hypothetical protein
MSNKFPGISFSDPLDAQNVGLTSWEAYARLSSSGGSTFVVSAAAPPAAPVTLLNPTSNGTDFQFAFLSQAGRTHTVESRTNLVLGPWVVVTNFAGDGTLKLVTLPLGTNGQTYFRAGTEQETNGAAGGRDPPTTGRVLERGSPRPLFSGAPEAPEASGAERAGGVFAFEALDAFLIPIYIFFNR